MSKKRNTEFLEAYVAFETICCEKFGMRSGGATEYINILIKEHGAPKRDTVLPKLVNYRNIRNRMAHEEGALSKIKEIDASDVRWLEKFAKSVSRQKDPVSVYIERTSKKSKLSGLLTAITVIVGSAVVAFIALLASGKISF